jgi:hypothetical protein
MEQIKHYTDKIPHACLYVKSASCKIDSKQAESR